MAGRFYASFLLVLTITLGVSPANQQYKNKIVIFFTQFSAFLMMGLHTFFDLVPFHVFRDSIGHVSLLSIAIFHMHKIFERQAATTILWFTLSTVKHFTSVSGHLHYFFSTLLHFIQVCWQMIAIMLYQMTVVAMTVAMDVRKCIENLLISDWRYHYYTYENYASTFNTDRLTVTS